MTLLHVTSKTPKCQQMHCIAIIFWNIEQRTIIMVEIRPKISSIWGAVLVFLKFFLYKKLNFLMSKNKICEIKIFFWKCRGALIKSGCITHVIVKLFWLLKIDLLISICKSFFRSSEIPISYQRMEFMSENDFWISEIQKSNFLYRTHL